MMSEMLGLGKPRRLLYVAFALGFAGLAIAGGVKGDATVIALGAVFALATAALAIFAPRLAARTNRDVRDVRTDVGTDL